MDEKVVFQVLLETQGNATKDVNDLTKALGAADAEAKQLAEAQKEVAKQAEKTGQEGKKATGGLVEGFKSAVKGAFSLRTAIALTGIGGLLQIVQQVVGFFKQFDAVADLVSNTLAGLGGAVTALVDNFGNLLSAAQDILLLDFSGAADKFAKAGNDIADGFTRARDANQELLDIEDAKAELIFEEAKTEGEIARLRRESADRSLSTEQRIALLRKSEELGIDILNKKKLLALREQDAIARQNAESLNQGDAAFLKLQEAKARTQRIENEILERKAQIQSKVNNLLESEKKPLKEIVDLEAQINQIRAARLIEDTRQREGNAAAARVQAKAELDAQLAALDAVNATEDQKNELRTLLTEENAKKLAKTEEDIAKRGQKATLEREAEFLREQQELLKLGEASDEVQLAAERAAALAELRVKELEAQEEDVVDRLEIEKKYNDGLERLEEERLTLEAAAEAQRAAIRQITIEGSLQVANALVEIANQAAEGSALAAVFAKAVAIAQSVFAIQQNIAQASAVGFPQNLPFIAAAIAQGAKILGALKKQPVPEPTPIAPITLAEAGGQAQRGAVVGYGFAEGTNYVPGPGTGTSDSILARLSRGEAVIPERINSMYDHKALDFLTNMSGLGGAGNTPLVHELHMNEHGFMRFLRGDAKRTRIRNRAHSFA